MLGEKTKPVCSLVVKNDVNVQTKKSESTVHHLFPGNDCQKCLRKTNERKEDNIEFFSISKMAAAKKKEKKITISISVFPKLLATAATLTCCSLFYTQIDKIRNLKK